MSVRGDFAGSIQPVDHLDESIIALLVENGRAAAKEIADQVDLSPDAVRERIRRLLDSELVRVTGAVTPGSVGVSAQALVGLRISGPVLPIARRLASVELIDFVACTTGPYDILVEVLGADSDQLFETLEANIRCIPEALHVETFLYLSIEKSRVPAVKNDGATSLRRLDSDELAIIDALRNDGRISYKALAAKTGVSYPTARRKAIALLESGIVQIHTHVHEDAVRDRVDAAIGIKVQGPLDGAIEYLRQVPEVDVMVTCTGRYDLLVDVITDSVESLRQLAGDTVRAAPGVVSTETLSYMSVLKLPYEWAVPSRA